jgi:hypothetical protein
MIRINELTNTIELSEYYNQFCENVVTNFSYYFYSQYDVEPAFYNSFKQCYKIINNNDKTDIYIDKNVQNKIITYLFLFTLTNHILRNTAPYIYLNVEKTDLMWQDIFNLFFDYFDSDVLLQYKETYSDDVEFAEIYENKIKERLEWNTENPIEFTIDFHNDFDISAIF